MSGRLWGSDMEEGRYKLDDFELYKVARAFRKRAYSLLKQLPLEEKYSLAVQMRRASVSVTNNIAEGHGRWHYQENIRFCRISRGSVDELIDDFNTCEDEGYGDQALVGGGLGHREPRLSRPPAADRGTRTAERAV